MLQKHILSTHYTHYYTVSVGTAGQPLVIVSESLWALSPDYQVDDAEVEHLLVRGVVGDLLFLLLYLPHQLLRLQTGSRKHKPSYVNRKKYV